MFLRTSNYVAVHFLLAYFLFEKVFCPDKTRLAEQGVQMVQIHIALHKGQASVGFQSA